MSTEGLKEVLGERQRTRMVQFLMKIRPEFKSIHGSLLNREFTPALDVVLAAVLREKTRLGTQATMESMPLPVVALLAQNQLSFTGHHILDCRRRPNRSRPAYQAYQMDVTKSKLTFPEPSQVHSRHPQNLKTEMTMAKGISVADVTRSNKLLTLWHNRMGHPHFSRLQHMLKSCLPTTYVIHSSLPLTCSNCAGSKSHKLHFPSSSSSYESV
ncbi:hypothetical protein KY285_016491 [Solanum tuberosum]|nr:hypothetical protein KY284_016491 [Solanum tuberosum]KAH0702213.1 hypothetical protein KY285_016491 [Solanum tuberosum]